MNPRCLRLSIPVCLLAVLTLLSPRLFAQATASGNIQGTVVDQSQAVVAGAEVTLTNLANGSTRTTTTNDSGTYRFELLSAGNYTAKINAKGFSTVEVKLELLVGQTATGNATLTPGSTSQTVQVSAVNPIVDLNKTSVSTDITPAEVEELPMVGRDVANLAYLAPGVKATDSYDPTKNRYAILSVNGAGGRNVNVTVNGVDNKDNTVGGPVMQLPLEAVQEFKISTQRFSAENGRSEGAAINMITKTGTNDYHGSVFGFFRNGALDTDEKVPDGTGGTLQRTPITAASSLADRLAVRSKRTSCLSSSASSGSAKTRASKRPGPRSTSCRLPKGRGSPRSPPVPSRAHSMRPAITAAWTGPSTARTTPTRATRPGQQQLNDQSTGTGDLTNGNFTANHLHLANFTLNSLLSIQPSTSSPSGFQYWNNLIASNISAPLVTFPRRILRHQHQRSAAVLPAKWQFKDDVSKTIGKHTLKGGVDFIDNPSEGGFFEFSSTLEIDFAADPSVILATPRPILRNSPRPAPSPA